MGLSKPGGILKQFLPVDFTYREISLKKFMGLQGLFQPDPSSRVLKRSVAKQ
jgi:hypothetical protein